MYIYVLVTQSYPLSNFLPQPLASVSIYVLYWYINVTRKVSVVNFVFISMSLLYHTTVREGTYAVSYDKNSQLLFCTGDLERSYSECHLGLLVCLLFCCTCANY